MQARVIGQQQDSVRGSGSSAVRMNSLVITHARSVDSSVIWRVSSRVLVFLMLLHPADSACVQELFDFAFLTNHLINHVVLLVDNKSQNVAEVHANAHKMLASNINYSGAVHVMPEDGILSCLAQHRSTIGCLLVHDSCPRTVAEAAAGQWTKAGGTAVWFGPADICPVGCTPAATVLGPDAVRWCVCSPLLLRSTPRQAQAHSGKGGGVVLDDKGVIVGLMEHFQTCRPALSIPDRAALACLASLARLEEDGQKTGLEAPRRQEEQGLEPCDLWKLASDASPSSCPTWLQWRAQGGTLPPPVQQPSARAARDSTPVTPPYRIGILGGSFNPPTVAHTQAALSVLACGAVEEVWLVPCGPRPDKPSLSAPGMPTTAQRHEMTRRAVQCMVPADLPVRMVPLELQEPVALASYTLLTQLHAWSEYLRLHGKGEDESTAGACTGCRLTAPVQFSLCIGADLVCGLHTWRHAEQLLESVHFLALPRPGDTLPRLPEEERTGTGTAKHLRWLSHPESLPFPFTMQASSNEVRRRVAASMRAEAEGESETGGGAPAVGCKGEGTQPPVTKEATGSRVVASIITLVPPVVARSIVEGGWYG